MFLQKHRLLQERFRSNSPSPKHTTRLEQAVRKVSVPEIRSHQKGNHHLNPTKHLIEYTRKLFRDGNKTQLDKSIGLDISNRHLKPQSRHNQCQTTNERFSRESRTAAARLYH